MNFEQTSALAQYHYDPSTGEIKNRAHCAFLLQLPGLVGVLGNAPEDTYYDITNDAFVAIPPQPSSYHAWNWSTKTWDDPRDLEWFRDAKWVEIKNQRSARTNGGFDVEGIGRFDSDPNAQRNITGTQAGAKLMVDAGMPFSVDWTLQNDTVVELDYEQLCLVGITMLQHIQAVRKVADELRAAVVAATSRAELDAITWPQ